MSSSPDTTDGPPCRGIEAKSSIGKVQSTQSLGDHAPEKFRSNIKVLVKFKKSATKTFEILTEVYGDKALSRARVFQWYKRFSRRRASIEDDEPTGCRMSVITVQNIAKIRDMSGFTLTTLVRLLIKFTTVQRVNEHYYIEVSKRLREN
ncbi:hypothetical protein TNCV_2902561 [Trichonephila clavipes]|nr:hypothetical protein TNCV_2902561 [Trichonephila clavipes]